MKKYLTYKKLLQSPPPSDPYLDAILRVISDFDDRVQNDNVLMLGIMDIERLITLYEFAQQDFTLGLSWREL